MTDECKDCGAQIHYDNGSWCDNSGGDVCGVAGEDSSHKPYEYRTHLDDFSHEELEKTKWDIGNLLLKHNSNPNLGRQFD